MADAVSRVRLATARVVTCLEFRDQVVATNGDRQSGRSEPLIWGCHVLCGMRLSMVVSLVGVALAELLTAAGVDEHAPALTGGAA